MAEIVKFFKERSQVIPQDVEGQGQSETKTEGENIDDCPVKESEVVAYVKPLFNLSQLLGIPGFAHLHSEVAKKKIYLLNAWNATLITNELLLIWGYLSGVDDTARLLNPVVILFLVHVHAILVHLWSMIYSKRLSQAFQNYCDMEAALRPYTSATDGRFSRIKGIAAAVLYSVFAISYTMKPVFSNVYFQRKTTFQSFRDYAELTPSSCPILPWFPIPEGFQDIYCLLSTLSTNFVWAFGDFLLLVLSVTFGEMFRRLNKRIAAAETEKLMASDVDLFREQHSLIANSVEEFDEPVSVLNLINMVFNLLLFVSHDYSRVQVRLREGVLENGEWSALSHFWMQYDALAVVVKVLIGTFAAAFLHRRAHAALRVVRTWPMNRTLEDDFSGSNSRASVIYLFASQLSSPKIGFTVFRIVTITSKFVCKLILAILVCFAINRIIAPSIIFVYYQNGAAPTSINGLGNNGNTLRIRTVLPGQVFNTTANIIDDGRSTSYVNFPYQNT